MPASKYGLIGHPLGHSLSPHIHQALMTAAEINGDYRLIDLPPQELPSAVPGLLSELDGFNCTIPYKQAIIRYLTVLDAKANLLQSVNTVWQGRGYNTDYQAFLDECPDMAGHKVLILGAGGVSRAMAFAAAACGAEIIITARRAEQAKNLVAAVQAADPSCLIRAMADLDEWLAAGPFDAPDGKPWGLLNGTPVGQWPNTSGMSFPPELLGHFSWVFDTIYNPSATRLILAARSRGIPAYSGLGMLFGQALAAERLWHADAKFPETELKKIRKQLTGAVSGQFPLTLLLTGFMGSGKTAAGKALAYKLGLSFFDLDQEIENMTGQSITDIFADSGEPAFRVMEREQLELLLKNGRSKVVATGGGALIEPEAELIARQNPALIIYLDTSLEEIRKRVGSGEGRPLLKNQSANRWNKLYLQRRARYLELYDLKVDGSGSARETAAAIAAGLGYGGETR